MYQIEVAPAADRDLDNLKRRIRRRDFERLRMAIRNLASDPRPPGVRKIEGTERAYRIRVGAYRVVYEVYDKEKLVLILRVARRTETTYR
ncbi:MAG: type II toxin-antitoxin system RelE/ParE family toxin [candidate division WOR-3 bacterium]